MAIHTNLLSTDTDSGSKPAAIYIHHEDKLLKVFMRKPETYIQKLMTESLHPGGQMPFESHYIDKLISISKKAQLTKTFTMEVIISATKRLEAKTSETKEKSGR